MLFADGDEEDDPDLVEKQCLEICNGSSKPEISSREKMTKAPFKLKSEKLIILVFT